MADANEHETPPSLTASQEEDPVLKALSTDANRSETEAAVHLADLPLPSEDVMEEEHKRETLTYTSDLSLSRRYDALRETPEGRSSGEADSTPKTMT